jgi:hypoxanthine phosphoribosyltransferase
MGPNYRRLLYSAADITRQVQRLASEISTDYQGREPILVGVLKGAFIFLADLVRCLTIPVKVDFIRLASYGGGTSSSGEVRILSDVILDLSQRDVLIVEDIVDSGFTTSFLLKHIMAQKPHSLKICTLLDKRERRSVAVPLDYVGLSLDEGFVIGYGLDCDEKHRQLPEIYELIV